MKPKNTLASTPLFVIFLFSFILFSCKKESTSISNASVQSSNREASELSLKHPIKKLEGEYDEVGTRFNYEGQVSDSILLSSSDLSEYSPKLITALSDSTITFDYANLGTSGWQLVITLNNRTRDIVKVEPNLTMAQGITPGSFIVYATKVNLQLKQFYFKTGYTNTSGNGRVCEETLTKQ